jgi:hypothetical protein
MRYTLRNPGAGHPVVIGDFSEPRKGRLESCGRLIENEGKRIQKPASIPR